MAGFLACFARFSFSDSLAFRALAILLSSASLFCAAGDADQSRLVSSIKTGGTHLRCLCCWATSVGAGGQNPLGWVFSYRWAEGRGRQAPGMLFLQEGQPDGWCCCEVRTEVLLSPADQTAARTGWDRNATSAFCKHKKGPRTAETAGPKSVVRGSAASASARNWWEMQNVVVQQIATWPCKANILQLNVHLKKNDYR